MQGIILVTLVVAIVVIALIFARDVGRARAQRAQQQPQPQAPAQPEAQPPAQPSAETGEMLGSSDIEALAGHVRELRRAVDEGLIGRDEAIKSIIRQADGRVGERAAEQLLDSAELD